MIYIVINAKGGAGKSTFANQILTAFLYDKNNKKVTFKEIDDENKDSLILSDSEILDSEIVSTTNIKSLDSIFLDDENDVVIDVGGNKTATIFMDELKNIEIDDNIVFCIPVTAGTQDVSNAYDITNDIKKLNNNANIMYVLSNAKSDTVEDLKDEFMQYFGNKFLNTPFAINSDNYVVIKFNPMINISKNYNKTVYDVSKSKQDFWAKAKEAKKANDNEEVEYNLMMNRFKNQSINYVNDLKENTFKKIDTILGKFKEKEE